MPWVKEKPPMRLPAEAIPTAVYRFRVPRGGSNVTRGVRVEISRNGVLGLDAPDGHHYPFWDKEDGNGFPYKELDRALAQYGINERPPQIPTEFKKPSYIVM